MNQVPTAYISIIKKQYEGKITHHPETIDIPVMPEKSIRFVGYEERRIRALKLGKIHLDKLEKKIPLCEKDENFNRCIKILRIINGKITKIIPNISDSPIFKGNPTYIMEVYNGVRAPGKILGRDAVAFLRKNIGYKYGFFCTIEQKNMGYIAKIWYPKEKGYRYHIIEYNSFSYTKSTLNASLHEFITNIGFGRMTVLEIKP